MAVVVLYWERIFPFDFKGKEIVKKDIFIMWVKIFIACVPAAIVGILWDDKINELFYNFKSVSLVLIVFGVLFIVIENYNKGKNPKVDNINNLSFKIAIIIGVFQLIAAVFPGTSRSGATIVGALLLGVSRGVAAEFTFFLAIPVMLGASLLKLIKFGVVFTSLEGIVLIVGIIISFIVSLFVIKFLMDYIKKHDFKVFGWYRIVLGCILLLNVLLIKS